MVDSRQKTTLATLKKYKQQRRPIAMLTCYDYATAVLLGQAGVDGILVGDSLVQMLLGHDSTLSATMDIMVTMSQAVRRGAPNTYLVGDMPFLSYQVSTAAAITNAGRFMAEAGCDAVKLEVDRRHVELVEALSVAGIPVVAHIGYRPQSAGRQEKVVATRAVGQACQLVQDALELVAAGASMLLLETVTTQAAKAVTERTDVPVIGCGSGVHCDGQVLVANEVLGLPGAAGFKFCKVYGQIGEQIRAAAKAYAVEVQQKQFPDDEHSFHIKSADEAEFERELARLDSMRDPKPGR